MGCQTDIAKKIIEKQADYVLAVKDNQKQLQEAIRDVLRSLGLLISPNYANCKCMKIWMPRMDA
jgi:hypothetical protein